MGLAIIMKKKHLQKTHAQLKTGQNEHPIYDQNGWKTTPYIRHIREYPPGILQEWKSLVRCTDESPQQRPSVIGPKILHWYSEGSQISSRRSRQRLNTQCDEVDIWIGDEMIRRVDHSKSQWSLWSAFLVKSCRWNMQESFLSYRSLKTTAAFYLS